jgi:D-aminopeptidase
MIVVATDAPLSDRNLARLAARAIMGLARTGSSASNGSGDFVLAFSTAPQVRRTVASGSRARADTSVTLRAAAELANDDMSGLFEGVIEATEEAIYNSLFMATSVTAKRRTVEAIPLERVREVLRKFNVGGR